MNISIHNNFSSPVVESNDYEHLLMKCRNDLDRIIEIRSEDAMEIKEILNHRVNYKITDKQTM